MARRWKLTWLPAEGAELVPLTLVDFGYLVTKRKLEDEDEFQDFVNEHSVRGAGACGGTSHCRALVAALPAGFSNVGGLVWLLRVRRRLVCQELSRRAEQLPALGASVGVGG